MRKEYVLMKDNYSKEDVERIIKSVAYDCVTLGYRKFAVSK